MIHVVLHYVQGCSQNWYLERFSCSSASALGPIGMKLSPIIENLILNIIYFMLWASKMQSRSPEIGKKAYLSASRAVARAARTQSKIRQRGRVGIGLPTTHTNFHENRSILASTYSQRTRTEAFSLRGCRARSAKSLSVGPSGPNNWAKLLLTL